MGTSPIRTHRWRFFPFWINPARHLIQNGRFGEQGGSVAFPPFWIKLRRRRALDPECAERHSLVAPPPRAEDRPRILRIHANRPRRNAKPMASHRVRRDSRANPLTPNTQPLPPASAPRIPDAHNQPQRPLSQATEFPSAILPRNLPQVPNLREVRPPPLPTRPERPARVGRAQPSEALGPGPARQIPPLTPCPRMDSLRTKSFELRPDPKVLGCRGQCHRGRRRARPLKSAAVALPQFLRAREGRTV